MLEPVHPPICYLTYNNHSFYWIDSEITGQNSEFGIPSTNWELTRKNTKTNKLLFFPWILHTENERTGVLYWHSKLKLSPSQNRFVIFAQYMATTSIFSLFSLPIGITFYSSFTSCLVKFTWDCILSQCCPESRPYRSANVFQAVECEKTLFVAFYLFILLLWADKWIFATEPESRLGFMEQVLCLSLF